MTLSQTPCRRAHRRRRGMNVVGMPPDRVTGLDFRDRDDAGHQLLVPPGPTPRARPGLGATEIVSATSSCIARRSIVGDAVGDRDEPQRPVRQRALPRQRRPALIGAEHAADGGRGELSRLQLVCPVEWIVARHSWRRRSRRLSGSRDRSSVSTVPASMCGERPSVLSPAAGGVPGRHRCTDCRDRTRRRRSTGDRGTRASRRAGSWRAITLWLRPMQMLKICGLPAP